MRFPLLILSGLLVVVVTAASMDAARADDTFYVDPDSVAAVWSQKHRDDPRAAKIKSAIADVPMARWFGQWSGDVRRAVSQYVDHAQGARQTPILVAYNIPDRDCGGASKGGAADPAAYRTWIDAFAQGINSRKAVVVLEPDATAQLACDKTDDKRIERLDLLHYAVTRLHDTAPGADVYIDGGNAHWVDAATMAARLNAAGLDRAKGFALNVSNFYTTQESVDYAQAVNAALQSQFGYTRSFAVDTSRNGNGADGQWCNPPGRKLGMPTGASAGNVLSLWIKSPGSSDGACGTAPSLAAGEFSPALAQHLIDGD